MSAPQQHWTDKPPDELMGIVLAWLNSYQGHKAMVLDQAAAMLQAQQARIERMERVVGAAEAFVDAYEHGPWQRVIPLFDALGEAVGEYRKDRREVQF